MWLRRSKRSRLILTATATGVLLLFTGVWILSRALPAHEKDAQRERGSPLWTIRKVLAPPPHPPKWDTDSVESRYFSESLTLRPDHTLSVSDCLHLIHLHGPTVRLRVGTVLTTVLDILTIERLGKLYLGQPPFVRTSFGVRFPT